MTDPRLVRPQWRGRTNVDALTIACIEHAESLAGHEFYVTQGSYQSGGGDINSAGTHDGGGVVDIRWCGHLACIGHMRRAGMAAWLRTPAQGPWVHHVHAVVVGHPLLAASAARQVTAYLNGRDGLARNGPDDGPRLNPIPRPVWPWPQEDDMADPAIKAQLDRIEKAAVRAATQAERARKGSYNRDVRMIGLITDKVLTALAASPVATDGIDAAEIEAAVRSAFETVLREGVGE